MSRAQYTLKMLEVFPLLLTSGCITVLLLWSALILLYIFHMSVYDVIDDTNLFKLSLFAIRRIRLPLAFARLKSKRFSFVRRPHKAAHALFCSLRACLQSSLPKGFGLVTLLKEAWGIELSAASVTRVVAVSAALSIPRWARSV